MHNQNLTQLLLEVVTLSKNMALNPHQTAQAFHKDSPKVPTMAKMFLCLVVLASIAELFLIFFFNMSAMSFDFLIFQIKSTLFDVFFSTVFLFLFALVFSFVSKFLGGNSSFNTSFAAVFVSFLPYALLKWLTPIPLAGAFLILALSLYCLYILYKITPLYFSLPKEKSLVFLIVSVILCGLIAAPITTLFQSSTQDIPMTLGQSSHNMNFLGGRVSDHDHVLLANNASFLLSSHI